MKFRIVCAWCSVVESEGDPGAPESHTICEVCAAKLLSTEVPRTITVHPQ